MSSEAHGNSGCSTFLITIAWAIYLIFRVAVPGIECEKDKSVYCEEFRRSFEYDIWKVLHYGRDYVHL